MDLMKLTEVRDALGEALRGGTRIWTGFSNQNHHLGDPHVFTWTGDDTATQTWLSNLITDQEDGETDSCLYTSSASPNPNMLADCDNHHWFVCEREVADTSRSVASTSDQEDIHHTTKLIDNNANKRWRKQVSGDVLSGILQRGTGTITGSDVCKVSNTGQQPVSAGDQCSCRTN
eukprot:TRINITY_DN95227_c0_g1_i1.p1 TRINITY_DN95227_c0_g1~~TRINITY_DN95227_c0_g1_i1.p1  ORF type:complete len:175 (-),score=22.05 TRINITY_DN95227_c0_g1_i1:198-722(-)